MKKKILKIALSAAFVCAVLAGCKKNVGSPEDNAVVETENTEETEQTEDADTEGENAEAAEEVEPGYKLGYSCIDMNNPYYEILKMAMEMALDDEEAEYTILTKDAGSDAEVQNQQIQELIDAEVDAVFLCPVDWEAVTPALEALNEAGIPVINLDTQVKESDLVQAYIGSENKTAGSACGKDLVKQCPDGGKVVILESTGMNSVNERITGFEQAIANGGFEVLDRADVNGEKEKAQEKMKEFLAKYSRIDAVMCGNDQAALGALAAVKEAGRTEIRIYGVDGSPEMKTELAKEESPAAGTAAQSPVTIGKAAADTVLAIIEGKEYEKETYVDTFFIDKEKVKLYGTNGWQ